MKRGLNYLSFTILLLTNFCWSIAQAQIPGNPRWDDQFCLDPRFECIGLGGGGEKPSISSNQGALSSGKKGYNTGCAMAWAAGLSVCQEFDEAPPPTGNPGEGSKPGEGSGSAPPVDRLGRSPQANSLPSQETSSILQAWLKPPKSFEGCLTLSDTAYRNLATSIANTKPGTVVHSTQISEALSVSSQFFGIAAIADQPKGFQVGFEVSLRQSRKRTKVPLTMHIVPGSQCLVARSTR